MKASNVNNAEGVHVFSDLANIEPVLSEAAKLYVHDQEHGGAKCSERHRFWVLQQHYNSPILLEGRKFHLRVNVLAQGSLLVTYPH